MKQVLIINVTRLGDLVQTGPLVTRLHQERPDMAVDLLVDTSCAPMAALLSGVRRVIAYDFQRLLVEARMHGRSVVALCAELTAWVTPLIETHYDRIINLTFTRPSALLTAVLSGRDVRGATAAPDGTIICRGSWMTYFANLARYRPFNRFNLVDLYALGGSGPGAFVPLSLTVPPSERDWIQPWLAAEAARARRAHAGPDAASGAGPTPTGRGAPGALPRTWIAVHLGASDPAKAWTPESFGHLLAIWGRRDPTSGFILLGTAPEQPAAQAALTAYAQRVDRATAGRVPVIQAVGRTTLPQLMAVLAQCQLLITNDTGPMHLAVALGTPVINLSVGPVDFRETGPYGPGHLVIQADLACAPCSFHRICVDQACKRRIPPELVVDLGLARLGHAAFPAWSSDVRVYESTIDEDGLGAFRLRMGHEDPLLTWYGWWWRRFWYEDLTGSPSRIPVPGPPPDLDTIRPVLETLRTAGPRLVRQARQVAAVASRSPLPVTELHAHQTRLDQDAQSILPIGLSSSATQPVTVMLLEQLRSLDAAEVSAMAWQQVEAYRQWHRRIATIAAAITRLSQPPPARPPRKESTHAHLPRSRDLGRRRVAVAGIRLDRA
ncbi:glycosyltransferase family 9 protein [Nitrospira sp. Kam-Ns4a]